MHGRIVIIPVARITVLFSFSYYGMTNSDYNNFRTFVFFIIMALFQRSSCTNLHDCADIIVVCNKCLMCTGLRSNTCRCSCGRQVALSLLLFACCSLSGVADAILDITGRCYERCKGELTLCLEQSMNNAAMDIVCFAAVFKCYDACRLRNSDNKKPSCPRPTYHWP